MKGLLLLALFSLALGQISFTNDRNITVNNQDFMYRDTQSELVNLGGFDAFFFKSLSVSATNTSATADGVFGAAYAALGLPPSAYLSFYHAASMWTANPNSVMTADVTASDGFIGKSFLFVDEVNANGTAVNQVRFDLLFWNAGSSNVGNGGLRQFTVTAAQRNGLNVTVTFVISDVSGILNVTGQPIVTPKSLESMITITNYTYQNAANSLRLTIGVGSGEANLQVQGTFTSGNGTGRVYFTLQGTAEVDGKTKSVNVSSFVDDRANSMNNNIAGQVNARYGAAASFKLVTVTFPAGAAKIVYDPTIGAGSMPDSANTTPVISGSQGPSQGQGQGGNENTAFAVVPSLLLLALIKLAF